MRLHGAWCPRKSLKRHPAQWGTSVMRHQHNETRVENYILLGWLWEDVWCWHQSALRPWIILLILMNVINIANLKFNKDSSTKCFFPESRWTCQHGRSSLLSFLWLHFGNEGLFGAGNLSLSFPESHAGRVNTASLAFYCSYNFLRW